jgi:hypothetical protein
MTAKEKAQELADRMGNIPDGGFGSIGLYEAKQCALVAVDEIMKAIGWDEIELGVDRDNYWTEVKQEIEKL